MPFNRELHRKKRGTYFNTYKVTAVHGATQYFQKASSAFTTSPTNFFVDHLNIKNAGSGQMTISLTMPSAPAGGVEVLQLPAGASFQIAGQEVQAVQITEINGNVFLVAEN